MPNEYEYMDRIKDEQERPSTPEDFRLGLHGLGDSLAPGFIELANKLAEKGEADVMHALGELSQRIRVMESTLQPHATSRSIDALLKYIDIDKRRVEAILDSGLVSDLDILRREIVRTLDDTRQMMTKSRLITHSGERQLRRLDRHSAYYRKPGADEIEEIEENA